MVLHCKNSFLNLHSIHSEASQYSQPISCSFSQKLISASKNLGAVIFRSVELKIGFQYLANRENRSKLKPWKKKAGRIEEITLFVVQTAQGQNVSNEALQREKKKNASSSPCSSSYKRERLKQTVFAHFCLTTNPSKAAVAPHIKAPLTRSPFGRQRLPEYWKDTVADYSWKMVAGM